MGGVLVALVGGAVTGNSNVHALVCAAIVSEIDLRRIVQRREIEDRFNLLARHVERGSIVLGTIGNDIRPRG
jgi:hypothetical protein